MREGGVSKHLVPQRNIRLQVGTAARPVADSSVAICGILPVTRHIRSRRIRMVDSGSDVQGRGRREANESPVGLSDELDLYWAVADAADTLVGFVCVEAAARALGLDADSPFIDVGVGMDPGLVSQGRGPAFGEAVLSRPADRITCASNTGRFNPPKLNSNLNPGRVPLSGSRR